MNARGPYKVKPRPDGARMVDRKITVDDSTVDVLRRLGAGNLSEGTRKAADIVRTIHVMVDREKPN